MARIWLGLAVLWLAGCNAIYTAPQVLRAAGPGQQVLVQPITPNSIKLANAATFQPRQLPAVFYTTSGGPAALGDVGTLPTPPLGPGGAPVRPAMNLPPAPVDAPYRIGVGDVVLLATRAGAGLRDITGSTVENLRQTYSVQSDGSIGIPDVGRVTLSGMTIDAAENAVFQALVRANIDPSVSLEIAEYRSQRVAIVAR